MKRENEWELETKGSHPDSDESGQQAEHALLEDYDGDDGVEKFQRRPLREKRSCSPASLRLSFYFGVLALFGLVAAFAAIVNGPRNRSKPTSAEFTGEAKVNEDSAYVLDPLWDFHAAPTTRHYHWTIEDVELNPDGVYRPMVLINRQFPGPLVECNEGDTIVVHVDNQASNATSIHWHGLFQNGTNWMDGTVGVTQCPIAPGAQFTYNFTVTGQSGTYWYHAHHSVQAADGLVGPFVIHSPDERAISMVKYRTDRVIMVQDHYYDLSGALLWQYLQSDRENAEPVPDTALINGKNIRNCDDLPHRRCDNSTATLASMDLESGQTHRIRFINTGTFAEFQIQIDEHEFGVLEVDGVQTKDKWYHRLNISPAQRYSIVVPTGIKTSPSFWMRARMVRHCFAYENPAMQEEVRAVVGYVPRGANSSNLTALPASKDWPEVIELECKDMDTSELIPRIPVPAPPTADKLIYLRSNFEIGAWRLDRGFFNQSSWRADVGSPSLHRAIDGFSTANASFTSSLAIPAGVNDKSFETSRELVYQTTGTQTIDILVSNFDDGNHPLHLHGHKFWVLASGRGYPPANLTTADRSNLGIDLSNPLRRDTALVEGFGWILLRFVADNPGMWAFHCHIAWHAEAGLLMQFLTGADALKDWALPKANAGLCGMQGIEKGKGPEDEVYFGTGATTDSSIPGR